MKQRYKCLVLIDGIPGPLVFKRYGETETEVRGELESFIREKYEAGCTIEMVELDKTHKYEPKKKVKKKNDDLAEKPAPETAEQAQTP